MSLSHEISHADDQFVRYLLGLLSEEEAERVDELSIADDEVAWRLRATENDLVDAYVRGTLNDTDRARFERVYLVTPKRRDKVRFATSLLAQIDPVAERTDAATAPAPAPATVLGWPQRLFAKPAAGWALAAAATILLVLSAALLLQTARLRGDLGTLESERAAADRRAQDLQQQVESQRATVAESSRELDRLRAQLSEASQRGNTEPRGGSLLAGGVALLLTPQTRSSGVMPALALRPGADGVSFALLLESNDFPRYQVALKDPATNAILWRSERLPAGTLNQAPAVSVIVPARLLKAQHYALELSGVRAAGAADVVASYVVRVVQ
jgi:hypothetical protein